MACKRVNFDVYRSLNIFSCIATLWQGIWSYQEEQGVEIKR